MTNSKHQALLILILLLGIFLLFSACRTIIVDTGSHDNGTVKPHKPDHNPPPQHEQGLRKGDVVTFRLVSLGQREKNALYKREGDVVRIRIKIISVESRYSYVAEFISLH
jgi:hypothetical protein